MSNKRNKKYIKNGEKIGYLNEIETKNIAPWLGSIRTTGAHLQKYVYCVAYF